MTYYVVILLESMTNVALSGASPDSGSTPEVKEAMMGALLEYKSAFMKPIVFETLMNHFADCIQVPSEQRTKVHV